MSRRPRTNYCCLSLTRRPNPGCPIFSRFSACRQFSLQRRSASFGSAAPRSSLLSFRRNKKKAASAPPTPINTAGFLINSSRFRLKQIYLKKSIYFLFLFFHSLFFFIFYYTPFF